MRPAGQIARGMGRFGPPLALMAVIFVLSAQPHLATDLGTLDLIGRKLIHMLEYGLLWLLWHRALGWRHGWAAAAIAIGYAATDEFHQTFVEGRQGHVRDVVIDTLGVIVAATAYRYWTFRQAIARAGRRS